MLGVARLRAADSPGPPEAAANLTQPDISAPTGELTEQFNGDVDVTGGAIWRQGPLLVTADRLHYDHRYNLITARGHVTMTDREERLLADYFEFHRADSSFLARNIRIEPRYPIIIQGQWAEGRGRTITIHHAIVTYTDPGHWKPSIKAREIVYEPGHYLKTVRSLIGLSGMEILPLGSIRENLNQAISESILSFDLGYRSYLGAIVGLGVHYPVLGNGRVGGDVAWFTKRGLMAGPAFSYSDTDENVTDTFVSGVVNDHGDRADDSVPQSPGPDGVIPPAPAVLDPRGYDVLDNPVPERREYASWTHQESWDNDNLTLDGEFNYWSDSDVTRDFFPRQFYDLQTPDNFLEALYSGQDDFAWAFTRYRPDNFVDVQQRLPEIGYAVSPTAIGDGFYERMDATMDVLRDQSPLGGPLLADDRLNAFYELSRPIDYAPLAAVFTPVAGGMLTDYSNTQGAAVGGGYLRPLGELGFDATAEASGTFNYQNSTWDIDGLRHLVEPELSYRFVPNADEGQDRIPAIDVPTFTTYLNPLELGDQRYLDQLEPENTLRIGLDNILQTRDPGYGSRNLIDLDVADDVNFVRTPGEPDFSDIHTELQFTPAHWIEYDLAQVFSPSTFNQREFESTLILRNGDLWTLQLASDYLQHEDNAYLLDYTQRINEQYEAFVLLEYDVHAHAFAESAVGINQNLVNTWSLRYLLNINAGPNRYGRSVGLEVEADVIRY